MLLLESRAHFLDHIFKKWSGPVSFLRFLYESSSRYSLVHIFYILIWNWALATLACAFCRPHLPNPSVFLHCFPIFIWNWALATVSFAFCQPLSGSRRAPAETETLQRRPWTATLHEKRHGVLRPRVFSTVHSRGRHDGATAGCENRS